MKIQELAIIFVIIILPISIVLSAFTQFQIKTINTQSLYDSKLTAATYDAIKAFQLNASNNAYSDMSNSEARDIEASVGAFKNSIMSAFEMTGYDQDDIDSYIPALVYTLYDGFYIYSPYTNVNHQYEVKTDASGNTVLDKYGKEVYDKDSPINGNGEELYGLKPYISYSCRYKRSNNDDVIITYTLDNYITVRGMIGGKYVNRSGYLVDGITYSETTDMVMYNGVEIKTEHLRENLADDVQSYMKFNGTKYYSKGDSIIYIANGKPTNQEDSADEEGKKFVEKFNEFVQENDSAKRYYKKAYEFTEWFENNAFLKNLTYGDAIDECGETSEEKIWPGDTRRIFEDDDNNIEDELSNFNQHRLAVIRQKIETNLAIAISNYNEYSGVASTNVFEMPELKENEWDQIINNVCLISFLQGLPIGGKVYNGYTIVTNSQSDKVVLEENIYILGSDKTYHRIGDNEIEGIGTIGVENYGNGTNSAGRLNLDFSRQMLLKYNGTKAYYYYPLKDYNASYNSIIMQNNVTTYDDIYIYVDKQSDEYKEAFYTALGREREGKYNKNNTITLYDYITANLIESSDTEEDPEQLPETFTVTYNRNGGTGTPGAQTKTEGVDLTLSTTIPTRSGYTFKGWSTSATGGVQYQPGGTYIYDADVTLYAIWEKILETYTVSYNANGGTGVPGEQTKTEGINLTLSSTKPTRSGYTFKGWSTSETGSVQYQPGGIYSNNENVVLYAVWEVKYYSVTYENNGGSGTPSGTKVQEGKTYTVSSQEPVKKGYKFNGWQGSDGKKYNSGDTFVVTQDIELVAKWSFDVGSLWPWNW